MFAGKKSAQIREILISESAWEEMTCLFAPSLEAMSYGIPCISSDCESGPEDIIKNGINGFLYSPGNLTEFTMLLNKIISEPLTISAKEIKESMFEFYDSVYYKNMNETILSVVHKSEK